MKIRIICVGRIKEPYLRKGIEFYRRQLSKKAEVEIIEVDDEKTPDGAGEKVELQIRRLEGQRIMKYLVPESHVFALCIEGRQYSTKKFHSYLQMVSKQYRNLIFIIGGSLGLSPEIVARADSKISFSAMTFPHQMMRMILLEQLNQSV